MRDAHRLRSFVCKVVLILSMCSVGSGVMATSLIPPSQPERFLIFEAGLDGEFGSSVIVLAKNAEDWDKAMKKISDSGGLAVAPARGAKELGFDWKHYSAILVALGSYPRAQYRLRVEGVQRHGAKLDLRVIVDPDRPELLRMTSPYVIVQVRRGDWHSARAQYRGGDGGNFATESLELGDDGSSSSSQVTWGEIKDLFH